MRAVNPGTPGFIPVFQGVIRELPARSPVSGKSRFAGTQRAGEVTMIRVTHQIFIAITALAFVAAAGADTDALVGQNDPHGIVRVDVEKRAEHIYPVKVVEINGNLVSADDKVALWLNPGKHTGSRTCRPGQHVRARPLSGAGQRKELGGDRRRGRQNLLSRRPDQSQGRRPVGTGCMEGKGTEGELIVPTFSLHPESPADAGLFSFRVRGPPTGARKLPALGMCHPRRWHFDMLPFGINGPTSPIPPRQFASRAQAAYKNVT